MTTPLGPVPLRSAAQHFTAPALTRRNLLRLAGLTCAAAPLSSFAQAVAAPVSPVMSALSSYMAQAAQKPLPENILELAKQHVLDTFAAMISGSRLGPGIAALRFAQASGSAGPCTLAASRLQTDALMAAFTNGMLAHSDETDDSHSPSLSHPGCAVVPAALAAAQFLQVDGSRFLRAVVLGYDVGPRVSTSLGAIDYQASSHRSSHAIAGVFGAAAAAGSCASLSAQQMRWLLDYTAQQTSGIAAWQRDTAHIEKAFVFAGMPARAGLTSALLVHSGWPGIDDIFSGPDNFFAAFGPGAQPATLIDQLGTRYEVARTNIKKWSVGSPVQASLDALESILRAHPLKPGQVASIQVQVASKEASVVNNRAMPDVCLQHLIAVMLIDGTVSFRAAHDLARMSEPATLAQRRKVQLIPSTELDAALPRREAIVTVTLTSGQSYVQRINDVRGTAQNPMTWQEIDAKCRDLIAPVLGSQQAAAILQQAHSLERCPNMRAWQSLLQATTA
ncbi:MAG: MmgE/PrpD family protein [Terracidiphilus sp.]